MIGLVVHFHEIHALPSTEVGLVASLKVNDLNTIAPKPCISTIMAIGSDVCNCHDGHLDISVFESMTNDMTLGSPSIDLECATVVKFVSIGSGHANTQRGVWNLDFGKVLLLLSTRPTAT